MAKKKPLYDKSVKESKIRYPKNVPDYKFADLVRRSGGKKNT